MDAFDNTISSISSALTTDDGQALSPLGRDILARAAAPLGADAEDMWQLARDAMAEVSSPSAWYTTFNALYIAFAAATAEGHVLTVEGEAVVTDLAHALGVDAASFKTELLALFDRSSDTVLEVGGAIAKIVP